MAEKIQEVGVGERLDGLNMRLTSLERIMYRELRGVRAEVWEGFRTLRAETKEELSELRRRH
jgi:hypothetical protein